MPAITKNSYSQEQHPWNWYIPRDATKLLIGTFPTAARNRKHDFFYCSSTNRFWEVVARVAEHPLELLNGENAIEERKEILGRLKLGLTDIGRIIYRQQASSKDHSLFPVEFMDIFQILKDHPVIQLLIVSGNSQGNSSLSWFCIFCSLNDIKLNVKELKKQHETEISMADRRVKVLLAYSPSRLSRITTEKLIDSYREMLSQSATPLPHFV
ncbi:hypothetical protein EFY79_00855 [Hanamia caeni]|jgi:G:T/U-mismatch repair DNA glycosylase|uniref:Uncharacterized protein n=1 Tax=Hanamia caeni TaxID=2294116 RepID=A0A3M9NQX1_9BACT|nr:hypothetical protein [Hanamia caeni]RNI39885.1 hypothetical protein EFY79_00855 [Hanamia caeni]